ncbi:MAG: TolC family protein, partial [Chitinophagia bacterium]|nr:TolC family protein [Chitinophagia bacterium]
MLPIVWAALLLTGGMGAQAQEERHLSMNDAIQLSMQNNKQLMLTRAKADEAKSNYDETVDNRLPDFKVSGSYLRVNNPDVTLKIKSSSSGSGSGESGGTPKVDQVVYGMANASLPFFSGFRLKYAIEAARYLKQAARLDVDQNRQEVIQNTVNAYGNLYKSYKTVDLVRQSLKQQQQRVADFSNMEKNGLMARNDLLKAQLQQSNVELALLDAQSNYKVTCLNMCLMLGLQENTVLIPDSIGSIAGENTNTLAEWEDKALSYRKDVAATGMREKAAQSAIRSTMGEYYPGFAVTGGYIAADIHNLLTVTNALNVGLGIQYNVSSIWKTAAKLGVQRARLHQVQISQSMLADQVRMDVNR